MGEVFLESATTMIVVPEGFDPFGPGADRASVWLGNGHSFSQLAFADALLAGDWSAPAEPRSFSLEGDGVAAVMCGDGQFDHWDSWLRQIVDLAAEG